MSIWPLLLTVASHNKSQGGYFISIFYDVYIRTDYMGILSQNKFSFLANITLLIVYMPCN